MLIVLGCIFGYAVGGVFGCAFFGCVALLIAFYYL